MKNDIINALFDDLKGEFDINEPKKDHQIRFLEKLNANAYVSQNKTTSRFNWKAVLAIAASLVIGFSLFITLQNQSEPADLASVSPELSEAQDFFTVTISNELKKINKERSPLTKAIIDDALAQIKILEKEYQKLKTDLTESGSDQRVIYAMISNFQSRIDILNTVLEQIEAVKQLKTNTNEKEYTI